MRKKDKTRQLLNLYEDSLTLTTIRGLSRKHGSLMVISDIGNIRHLFNEANGFRRVLNGDRGIPANKINVCTIEYLRMHPDALKDYNAIILYCIAGLGRKSKPVLLKIMKNIQFIYWFRHYMDGNIEQCISETW
jgi:hypothetical protein